MAADLESIYLGMRRSLMATALRVVRDPQIAEDLAQESYLRVRRAMEKGPVEHVEAFLHRTAHNLALDYLRKNRTRGHVETMDAAAPSALDVADATPSAEERMIQADRLHALKGQPVRRSCLGGGCGDGRSTDVDSRLYSRIFGRCCRRR